MRTPTADELLDVWSGASGMHRLDRSAPLLRLVAAVDTAGDLGVGDRDRLLVEVHELLFGEVLRAVADCPSCGLTQAVTIPTDALLEAPLDEIVELDFGELHLRCRVPRVADLADAAATRSPTGARALLVSRAVVAAVQHGRPVPATDLPDEVVAAVARALAEADPLADAEITISCEDCGSSWTVALDIDDYLWRELDAWALRLLGDIHLLAAAYGWSEAEVLAVPPRRRRHYLDLAGHG